MIINRKQKQLKCTRQTTRSTKYKQYKLAVTHSFPNVQYFWHTIRIQLFIERGALFLDCESLKKFVVRFTSASMNNIEVSVGSIFTGDAFVYMVFDLGLFFALDLQMLFSPCEQVPYSVADIAVGARFILTVKLVHNIRRQVERWKTFQWKIRFNFESTIYNINLSIRNHSWKRASKIRNTKNSSRNRIVINRSI